MSDAEKSAPMPTDLRPELNILEQARQNWAEVYLILDFISGKAGKSLGDLKDFPYQPQNAAAEGGNAGIADKDDRHCASIINYFYEIGAKINNKTEASAEDLQFLLRLKDRLNSMAEPAKGQSIAFTSMIVNDHMGEAAGNTGCLLKRWVQNIWRCVASLFNIRINGIASDPEEDIIKQMGRGRYAKIAYPDLKTNSISYYKYIVIYIPIFLFFLVAVSTATSWDVYYVKERTQRIIDLNSLKFADGTLVTDEICALSGASQNKVDVAKTCAQWPLNKVAIKVERKNLLAYAYQRFTPDKEFPAEFFRHFWKLQDTFDLLKWHLRAVMPTLRVDDEDHIEILLAPYSDLFINGVLPMLFGLLGTLAGVMRNALSRMSNWLLSPGDVPQAYFSLPLGVVAGFIVGQYISPASINGTGLSLSAGGLSFIAGYGSEYFFKSLDSLLKRVFAADQK
jgi:hypothetical protein